MSATYNRKTTEIVRISKEAKRHLFEIVKHRRARGLSASGASILNELILSIPIDSGGTPA